MKLKTVLLFLIISVISAQIKSQTLSLVKDINTSSFNNAFPHYLTLFNDKIYFVANDGVSNKLYVSDGTTAGTQFIGPMAGNGIVYYLMVYNNQLIFTYDDGVNGLELWTSDGTAAGTNLLKDIWEGSLSALPRFYTECNGLLFFQASTPTRAEGLWVTDGTADGTHMVMNIYANSLIDKFVSYNNNIYFQGNAGGGYGMWKSDGTEAGTVLIQPGNFGNGTGRYAICNNKFYFSGSDQDNGPEIWESDGTDLGTHILADIYPDAFGSETSEFFCFQNMVFFSANNGTDGQELYVTDGTEAGTHIVSDINPAAAESYPEHMMVLNNEVYFFAFNGTTVGLYKTDGTNAGTELISAITGFSDVSYAYAFDNKIYFYANAGNPYSLQLFKSDGTASGTFAITPAVTSIEYPDLNFIGYNDELYLPANYAINGVELCKLANSPDFVSENNKSSLEVFSLYPNPANDFLEIKNNSTSPIVQIDLLDMMGNTVMSTQMSASLNKRLDLTNIAAGNYQVVIKNNESVYSLKLVKN
jgi:ELWxxDGT repeat protein